MKSFLLIFALASSFSIIAQTATVSGTVTDNGAKEAVVGAKVIFSPKFRAITDFEGDYEIKDVPFGEYNLVITMLSFDTLYLTVKVDEANFTNDIILGGSQEIDAVSVIGNLAQDRKTPVAVTTIGTKEIGEELGSQDLPMILNSKPGVHATQQGGGDGDARITIRGFDQRNIGVMIDGVPVNDMENGAVYWSNWFGLDAITSQIQVQRGLGATKLAMPSVGGTMNILTQNTGGKRQIKFRQEYGTGNFLRTSMSYKSGSLKNGWGVLFSGSYKQGDGWVDGLSTQGGFYYLKVQKKVKNHVISLSGFGAPQQHGQRSYSQPIEYWDSDYAQTVGVRPSDIDTLGNRGLQYNEHWGYRTDENGDKQVFAERRNYYHKPQVTLKDFWKINDKLSWSNTAYMSIGRGGGQRYFGSGSTITRDENGQVDWDEIVYNNQFKTLFGQVLPTTDVAYDPTLLKSSQILSASVNNHFWLGGLSQFDYKLGEKWNIAGGLDYRYYKGTHFTEILDLLGGEYFINESDLNAETTMKVVGDKIAREDRPYQNYRDGLVQWAGGFGQAEYSFGQWTAFANVSVVGNFYKGIDYFRNKQITLGGETFVIDDTTSIEYDGQTYDANSPELVDNQTEWIKKLGVTFKTGANFNIDEKSNVFVNVGYLSRTPQYSNVINNNLNQPFDELINENILAFEVGYGFRSKKLSANFNAYYTRWENRPLPFGLSIPDPNDPLEFITVNVPGMDALHMGAEVDIAYKPTNKLTIEGMVSLGDWTWQSSEEIQVYDEIITFYATGVHVGNAAQSTGGASIRYQFVKNGYVKLKYSVFGRYYSSFDPTSLTTPDDTKYELIDDTNPDLGYQDLAGNPVAFDDLEGRDSWIVPSYGLMSLHAGYTVKFEKSQLNFRANVFNVLNSRYISDARNNRHQDGSSDFDANSATVFVGQGVRFNLSLGFQF